MADKMRVHILARELNVASKEIIAKCKAEGLKVTNHMSTLSAGLEATIMDNVIGHQPFGVRLNVDPEVTGMTNDDVVARLKEGDPPVWTRVKEGEDFIAIHMFGLRDGEERIVGERIAALFDGD